MPNKTKTAGGRQPGMHKQKKSAGKKRNAPVKTPRQTQPKKTGSNAGRVSSVICPSFNSVNALRFPISFRNYKIKVEPGHSAIAVLAPFNDCLGIVYKQGASPPSANNASHPITQDAIVDPYLTSLLTPLDTSGAINAAAVRFTRFCVEIMSVEAVGQISGTVQILRWNQSGVPITSSGAAVEFASVYDSVCTDDNMHEVTSAQLLTNHCIKSGMADRSALEFTPVILGAPQWASAYAHTGGSTELGTFNMPFRPIIIAVTSPYGQAFNGPVTLRLIVKAEVEVVPPERSFLSRMAKPLPVGGVGSEERWWQAQNAINKSPLVVARDSQSRSAKAFVGR